MTSLFNRVIDTIDERRERILKGGENCIPFPFKRFSQELPGIEQKQYYIVTANSKVGKSKITDSLFVYNPLQYIINNKDTKLKLKIFYFTLEMSKEQKMLNCMSNYLYTVSGGSLRLSPKELRSTRDVLSKEVVDTLKECEDYFQKLEECVEFIDSIRNPFGIYKFMREYANANGTQHYKDIEINGITHTVNDYYEPNNPDEYVMIIVDHAALLTPENNESLHSAISSLSSNYFVKLRNRFNYIPVLIQQQAAAQESVTNLKEGKLRPSLDGLGDNKLTQRDADVILGLFSPYRHEIEKYGGYDIKIFKDSIRFLEIVGSREGGSGTYPLYFDGAVDYFEELPKPTDIVGLKSFYSLIENRH